MAEIKLREIHGITVLDMKGPLTIKDGDELPHKTFCQLQESSRSLFVINLADVPYIEDSPLGMLLYCCGQVTTSGGHVKIVNARPRVADFIKMTKTSGLLFQFCDNEETAIAALKLHRSK